MTASADHDAAIRAHILHGLADAAEQCEKKAGDYKAAGDAASADFMAHAAMRYRQAAVSTPGAWAIADQALIELAMAAGNPTTEACAARDTEEIPRVH